MIEKRIRDKYVPTIGLEVHAQLATESKIFASDSNSFGDHPNTNISTITLGHPGTMPKLNQKVVDFALKLGLACNCDINKESYFDRKNYFYPDLPKGYQLTQDRFPICVGGGVKIRLENGEDRIVELHKIHMEEDAGKSIHVEGKNYTQVDLNRAGVPLLEIVTEPDIFSSEQAVAFLTEIRKIVRYLGICDGNMEEGSLRCDANISVRLNSETTLGKKVEVKNMNSIRNVSRAIEHEIERQITLVERGEEVISETRTFDVTTGTTSGMRTKEELNDYRYFPDPDLSPVQVTDEWIAKVKSEMPALPEELFNEFVAVYQLPVYNANVLTDDQAMALYFKEVCRHTTEYRAVSNWLMGIVKSHLNDTSTDLRDFPLRADVLASLIDLIKAGKVSNSVASQQLFPYLLENTSVTVEQAAEILNVIQDSSEDAIQPMIDEVLEAFPDKVKAYRNGKKGLVGMFMGEVMKKTKGKVDPQVANKMLRESLESQ
ncbi:MAG: Asp-tRNA(Asn)/Glu-tRNA(Gln) amidotransferase subunit GatB [Cyclobacteriaceae bacterium]|nr:Asp-tRNA(Asn)/Glu-tRNA(Gln) amidotransferase subunit GatB [Cyclobacteriaceae bacterium HetDA_MAG_MS6]